MHVHAHKNAISRSDTRTYAIRTHRSYIPLHTHSDTHFNIYIFIRTPTCTHIHSLTHTHAHAHTHIRAHTHAHIHTRTKRMTVIALIAIDVRKQGCGLNGRLMWNYIDCLLWN